MKKQKIIFVMHELTAGGAERVIVNLVNGFDREKFEVQLCLFIKKGWLINLLKNDIIIHDLNSQRVSKGVFKFVNLLRLEKPDIVFSSIGHINLLISLLLKPLRLYLKNTKFIVREVNIPSVRSHYLSSSAKQDLLYKKTINFYDCIIAQSNFMKRDLIESYNIDPIKVTVIPNPLDIKSIQDSFLHCENEVLFAPDKVKILAVGYLRKQKGFKLLLEAVPYLNDKLHLYILGEGAERNELELIIERLKITDKVTLLGAKENPYKYMKQADLIVLSSLYEGFPNVIIEANACGKFVVAFECPGVNEEIITNGTNGCLVKFANIKELAREINYQSKKVHNESLIISTTERFQVNKVIMHYERLIEGFSSP